MAVGYENLSNVREQTDQILNKEVRVATRLTEEEKQADGIYGMRQTQEDQMAIHQALVNASGLNLSDRDQYRLKAIRGRNISHLLVNQDQFSKDSKEMTQVKHDVEYLEQLLAEDWQEDAALQMIQGLEGAYQLAIASCRYYCDHKNPTFRSGKERKQMVLEELAQLQQEYEQLQNAKKLAETNQLPQNLDHARDLLVEIQAERQEAQTDSASPIASLTYADFAAMLGTHNRGQIEFDGKGLRMINNSVFSVSDGSVSAENFLVREKLFILASEKMGERGTPEIRMQMMEQLGLKGSERECKPLSRKELHDILARVNWESSKVTQVLGDKSQQESTAYRFAQESTRIIGNSLGNWEVTYSSKQTAENLRSEIKNLIRTAKKKGIGTDYPDLTEHQLNQLVQGNIALLRDEIFQSMSEAYDMCSRVNGGQLIDESAITDNENLKLELAVHAIMKLTAMTEDARKFAEYEKRAMLTRSAFETTGKQELLRDMRDAHLGELAARGSAGLQQELDRHLFDCEAWREDPKRMQRGCDDLTRLCDALQKFANLQQTAIDQGILPEEETLLRELGGNIRNLLQKLTEERDDGSCSDMEFVSRELQGSRFKAGIDLAKELMSREQSFSYEDFANRFVTQIRPIAVRHRVSEPNPQMSALAETVNQQMETLKPGQRQLVEVLMLQKSASSLIEKQGDDHAKELLQLRDFLRSFEGGVPKIIDANLLGVRVRVIHGETGSLSLEINQQTILLPYSTRMIAERLEMDMVSNESHYDAEDMTTILRNLRTEDTNGGQMVRTRSMCLKILESRTGQSAAYFNNVPSDRIKQYALDLLNQTMTKEQVIAEVNRVENSALINGEEALALLRRSSQLQAEEMRVSYKNIPQAQRDAAGDEEAAKWTQQEEKVKNLLSDLVFSNRTWEMDENEKQTESAYRQAVEENDEKNIQRLERVRSAGRIRRVIMNYPDTLYEVFKQPEILDRMLKKLPFPESEDGSVNMKATISEAVKELLEMPELKLIRTFANGPFEKEIKQNFSQALGNALNHPKAVEKLAQIDIQIDESVTACIDVVQKTIAKAADSAFGNKQKNTREEEAEKTKSDFKDKKEWIQYSRNLLQNILQETADGERGQGLFMKLVFQNYFKSVSKFDQRAMLASALRGAEPQKEEGDAQSEEEQKRILGNYLAGIFKGAGPLLQKMLQGMPIDSMPPELQKALKDTRSNLAPIAPEIVKAQMQSMIERSNGKVTDIVIDRTLGAASVGQAFLCKFYGPNLPKTGEDVVVKLLRPDVRNHMMREKKVMLECARMTDIQSGWTDTEHMGGMEATYTGQLQRIEEELDLTIEARNIERGRIYDRGPINENNRVQAMKQNPLVEPTVNALAVEKAPGETLDKYMERVKIQIEKLRKPYLNDDREEMVHQADAIRTLMDLYQELVKKQKYLLELSRRWVEEGVFGKGFYHGDLHAGNIMVDDDCMTMIDFGNATQLNEQQQRHVIKMMMGAAYHMVDDFQDSFHALLEKTPENVYQEKKEALKDVISKTLEMGNQEDTGSRIAAILIKAQELGLELPPAIANFSQSQIRLQQTIEQMNERIREAQNTLNYVQGIMPKIPNTVDLLAQLMNMSFSYKTVISDSTNLMPVNIERNAFLAEISSKTTKDSRAQFLETCKKSLSDSQNSLKVENVFARMIELTDPLVLDALKNASPSSMQKTMGVIQSEKSLLISALSQIEYRYRLEDNEQFRQIKNQMTADLMNADIDTLSQSLRTHKNNLEKLETAYQKEDKENELSKKIEKLWQLQDDPKASVQEQKVMQDEIYTSYLRQYITELENQPSAFYSPIVANIRNRKYGETPLEYLYADKENYGDEIKMAYAAYSEAKHQNSPDTELAYLKLMEVYMQAQGNRIAKYNASYTKLREWAEDKTVFVQPETFFDVMGDVIMNNKAAAIDRLGFLYSLKITFH